MSPPAVARLSNPGEILAVLPSLCGFHPADSLVLLSLRGPRQRVGLTARVDLPPPGLERRVADSCVERLVADGARSVVLAVYDDTGRRPGLVTAVRRACDGRGLPVLEALHVQGGRWTSYSCEAACCPPTGTPLPASSPALGLVEAERVRSGQAVLASRDELVRSLAPPVDATAASERLQEAGRAWARSRVEHGAAGARARTLALAGVLLDRVAQGGSVTAGEAAALTAGLADVQARDGLAHVLLTRSDELLALLLQVATQVVPPHDAPVCALLAWAAHARGNGALANVALDRALAGSPEYSLALLLRAALDAGMPPEQVRGLARGLGGGRRTRATGPARR